MNKRGREEQGSMGRGDGSADENLCEEDADISGQKNMNMFVFIDRYSVLPTHTCNYFINHIFKLFEENVSSVLPCNSATMFMRYG